jgi:hypothetical protein
MPRRARVAPGGLVYHVLNRSVAGLPLFRKEKGFMNRHPYLVGAMLAIATLLLCWGAVIFQFDSMRNAVRYLQGYNYVVSPIAADVGEGFRGEKRTVSIRIRNLSFSPIRVIGAITTCNCVQPEGLPLTILPRSVGDLLITIHLESKTGDVEQTAELLVDAGGMQRTVVVITGKCQAKTEDRVSQTETHPTGAPI